MRERIVKLEEMSQRNQLKELFVRLLESTGNGWIPVKGRFS